MVTYNVLHSNADINSLNDIDNEQVQVKVAASRGQDVVLDAPKTVSNTKDSNYECCTIA